LATITTQQIVGFIQSKIAETHAAGDDILLLLANPEIAFSLQVLDGNYTNAQHAPKKMTVEQKNDSRTK
jgi:hypothetical protein